MGILMSKFYEHYVSSSLSRKYLYKFHINDHPYPVLHGHTDYWEFTILTEGRLTDALNGERKLRIAGDVFFAGPTDVHYVAAVDNAPMRYVTIMVEEETFLKLAHAISPNLLDVLKENDGFAASENLIASIETILHQVNSSDRRDTKTWNDFLCSAVLLILQTLLLQSATHNMSPVAKPWQSNLYRVMNLPNSPLYKVSDLCELLSYSRMQLNRLFQEDFNMTPHEYLLQFRLKYSANLLIHTPKTIIEISSDVGFTNLSQFNAAFKKQYGITPTQFRKTM